MSGLPGLPRGQIRPDPSPSRRASASAVESAVPPGGRTWLCGQFSARSLSDRNPGEGERERGGNRNRLKRSEGETVRLREGDSGGVSEDGQRAFPARRAARGAGGRREWQGH